MNKIILIGRLTRDVEMRYGTNNNNTAIARYTLAVNRPYRQDGGPEAFFNYGTNTLKEKKYDI